MLITVFLMVNNMEIIKFFRFNEDLYRLDFLKKCLTFLFLFATFYTKLYILINVINNDVIAGLIYFLGVKVIFYILMSTLIGKYNTFSFARHRILHPQLALDKIKAMTARLILTIYVLYNDIDISPIYSFY